jgi:hypothetical protein
MSSAGIQPLDEDKSHALGCRYWNDHFHPIWEGLGADVDVKQHAARVLGKTVTEPEADLLYQVTNPVAGTIYSQVSAKLRDRRERLKTSIKDGLGGVFVENQNVRRAELFLQGIRTELEKTVRFWDAVGTPRRGDLDAWSSRARLLVRQAMEKQGLVSRALAARSELFYEELAKIVVQLQMYLMKQTLSEILEWINDDLARWLGTLRRSLEGVQEIAAGRGRSIAGRMQELSGPILKISRSREEPFQVEIDELSGAEPAFNPPLLKAKDGNFEGLLAVKERPGPGDNRQIFIGLKNALQPGRLRALEEKGHVDLVSQIRSQDRIHQVVDHFRDAQGMSLATRIPLKKAVAIVPSFVLGASQDSARSLIEEMRQVMGNPPQAAPHPLPMFDHMIIFYQEGACSVQPGEIYQSIPDVLADAAAYREHYDSKMKVRGDNLDPLASMKVNQVKAAVKASNDAKGEGGE